MSRNKLSFLVGCITVVALQSSIFTNSAQAQRSCCVKPAPSYEIWTLFGVDPYRRTGVYPTPTCGCPNCLALSANQFGTVGPSNVVELADSAAQPPNPGVAIVDALDRDTAASPSDVRVNGDTTIAAPIPAESPNPPGVKEDFEAEIAKLRAQLESATEQARASAQRARAAEKASQAARNKSQAQLANLRDQIKAAQQSAEQAAKQKQTAETRIAVLEKNLAATKGTVSKLQKQIQNGKPESNPKSAAEPKTDSGKRPSPPQPPKPAARPDQDPPNQSQPTNPKPQPAQNKNQRQQKSRRAQLQQQIKQLESGLPKQIETTNGKISKQFEDQIAKLLEAGTDEKSDEVKAVREEMNRKLEENEMKIRENLQEKIEKLRKEIRALSNS